jgi:uncharacterized protein YjdB
MRILSLFFLGWLLSANNSQAQNASACTGSTPALLARNTTPYSCSPGLATAPAFTQNASGSQMTNTEYILTKAGAIAADGLGRPIVGTTASSSFAPSGAASNLTLMPGDSFYLTPFSYNLSQTQQIVDAILTGTTTTGSTCCQVIGTFVPTACQDLAAAGINSGADITNLGVAIAAIRALTANTNTMSIQGFVDNINALNSQLNNPLFPVPCGRSLIPFCYAVNLPDQARFDINTPDVLISGITVTPNNSSIVGGNTQQMTASISPTSATNPSVIWYVISGTAASINSTTGMLSTTVQSSTAAVVTIRANAADNSGVTGTAVLTITVANPVNSISISPDTAIIFTGGSLFTPTATILPSNATNAGLAWSVVSGTAVSINISTGQVSPLSVGFVTIRATAQDGSGAYDEAVIEVRNPVVLPTSISVSPNNSTLTATGASLQLTANVSPSNANNTSVSWSMQAGNSVSVSTSGLVTAISNGTSTVRATSNAVASVTGDATIIVNTATGIENAPANATIYTIFPNPSTGTSRLIIQNSPVIQTHTILIMNNLGQLVSSQSVEMQGLQQQVIELATQNLEAGIYQISIQNSVNRQTVQFVKQ